MQQNHTEPVAFLGPEGTFSEEALLASMPTGCHPFPYQSIADVMAAVSDGSARYGLVPIENSLEGAVAITLDLLAFGHDDLSIVRETTHTVHQQLIARAPLDLAHVSKVISHPQVYGQCRSFLREYLPNAEHEAANSTAEAVRQVSRVERPWVAIGPKLAADMYECLVVHENIEDSVDNRTRFVFLAREPAAQDLDTPYKTSIVCGIAQDQPGSLLLILSEFAYRYVNLTKIESRPSKQGLGDYIFFIDMEGRLSDPAIDLALKGLECKLAWVKILGSYPVT
ncbi:MAG: prephenate dehydratase [Thermoleophilia bacterium]